MTKRIVILIIAVVLTIPIYAQKSNLGAWFNYIGNQKLGNSNWNWYNEMQYRNYSVDGDLDQLILRTGLGYSLNPNVNLLMGYGFIHNKAYAFPDSEERKIFNEHRIFQQLMIKQSFGKLDIQNRYRFEQRILPNVFKVRLRYSLNLSYPFTKPKMEKNALYAVAYNEIFINTQKNIFDRNRLFAGIGYFIHNDLRFDVGFMRQMLEINSRNQLMVSFYNSLPF